MLTREVMIHRRIDFLTPALLADGIAAARNWRDALVLGFLAQVIQVIKILLLSMRSILYFIIYMALASHHPMRFFSIRHTISR